MLGKDWENYEPEPKRKSIGECLKCGAGILDGDLGVSFRVCGDKFYLCAECCVPLELWEEEK